MVSQNVNVKLTACRPIRIQNEVHFVLVDVDVTVVTLDGRGDGRHRHGGHH